MFLELMPLFLCQQANQAPDQKGGAETGQEGAEIGRCQIQSAALDPLPVSRRPVDGSDPLLIFDIVLIPAHRVDLGICPFGNGGILTRCNQEFSVFITGKPDQQILRV